MPARCTHIMPSAMSPQAEAEAAAHLWVSTLMEVTPGTEKSKGGTG